MITTPFIDLCMSVTLVSQHVSFRKKKTLSVDDLDLHTDSKGKSSLTGSAVGSFKVIKVLVSFSLITRGSRA